MKATVYVLNPSTGVWDTSQTLPSVNQQTWQQLRALEEEYQGQIRVDYEGATPLQQLGGFLKNPGQGFPLCGKCGGLHDPRATECPPRYCPMCCTTHKPNQFEKFNNCERNERFKRNYAGHMAWCRQNTKEIWAQPNREPDEDDEKDGEQ